ncbi:hypothetical protein TraAM80_04322 [Trypanosoma rangeli]|uniref:Uncharacterized protein n=1 Tax=Trypanosoma rangeli TaxID=5698 RepID=A0A422NKD6_TRYRA|nr:uncharacterized protein TraAM80_04322 [Trypanosoma rangeli]RNF05789.1 hypothetical protein TraAM80_04322 [Trypanosoma rangeli]|eukprot:RNF05789.1 hypothetical protein TraAM80_04322 [Trypanosoma rangeli]
MFLRSKRYKLSSDDAVSHSSYKNAYQERPASAPTAGGAPRVEHRLHLVKRNGMSLTPEPPEEKCDLSPRLYTISLPPAVEPPCAMYPAFDVSRLSKHEQHIVEALVAEVADAIAFPSLQEELTQ